MITLAKAPGAGAALGGFTMPHDEAIHRRASASGDFADEVLFDDPALVVSLIHFADDSHAVRLDLLERGLSLVVDTPAWLDLDTVIPAVSADEPTLGVGYAIVERDADGEQVGYQLTLQGGDVVSRVSVVLHQGELDLLRTAAEAGRERVEAADELDHQVQPPGDGIA